METAGTKKLLLKSVLTLLLFTGTLFLLGIFSAVRASAATLEFDPSSTSFVRGCDRSIDIIVDATGESSNGAELIVTYDPAVITIRDSNTGQSGTQILPGNAYTTPLINTVDSGAGTITYSAASFFGTLTDRRTLATIEFTSSPSATSTTFTINFDGVGNTFDANVADSNDNSDLLTGVTNGSYTFTPGSCTPDNTSPTISFTSPTNGQTGYPSNGNITLQISDDNAGVDLANTSFTVNGTTYVPADSQVSVSGSPSNYTFVINPDTDFPTTSASTVNVSTEDFSGNARNGSITFNQPAVDNQAPNISFQSPTNGQSGFPANGNITIRITDNLSGIDLGNTTFNVNGTVYRPADSQVTYTGSSTDYTFTINPDSNFPNTSASTVSVSTRDVSGNTRSGNITFNQPDSSGPTITFLSPTNGQTGFALDGNLQVRISDSDPGVDLNNTVFTINGTEYRPSNPTVTYTGGSTDYTFTINPSANLPAFTQISFAVSTRDLAGNTSNGSINFNNPDSSGPSIEFISPTNSQTGFSLDGNFQVRISDSDPGVDLDEVTFVIDGITYTPDDPQVTFTGGENNYTFTINPDANLPANKEITFRVDAEDQAGNSSSRTIRFNNPPPDRIPPEVTFVNPEAITDRLGTNDIIQFIITDNDEGLDLDSLEVNLNGTIFTVNDPGLTYQGAPLNYTFFLDSGGQILADDVNILRISGTDERNNRFDRQIVFNLPESLLVQQVACPVLEENSCSITTSTFTEIFDGPAVFGGTPLGPLEEELGLEGLSSTTAIAAVASTMLPFQLLLSPRMLYQFIKQLTKRKQNGTWGIVSDNFSGEPLPFATCKLYVAGNPNKIAQTFTDNKGRYSFKSVGPGTYKLAVIKDGFMKYTTEITIPEDDKFVVHNVKLSTEEVTPNIIQFAIKTVRETIGKFLNRYRNEIFIIGFTIATIAFISEQSVVNGVIFGLYSTMTATYTVQKLFLGRKTANRPSIMDASTNIKIPFATVFLFDPVSGKLIDSQKTDKSGFFDANVEPGQYAVVVEANGYKFPSTKSTYSTSNTIFGPGVMVNVNKKKNRFFIPLDPAGDKVASTITPAMQPKPQVTNSAMLQVGNLITPGAI